MLTVFPLDVSFLSFIKVSFAEQKIKLKNNIFQHKPDIRLGLARSYAENISFSALHNVCMCMRERESIQFQLSS